MRKDFIENYTDAVKRYMVIVIGRETGKYFTIYQGTLENKGEEVRDDVHKKIKASGANEDKIQNHIQEELRRHIKNVDEQAFHFYKKLKHQVDGVYIGGHQELLKTIESNLHTELKQLVLGSFVTDVDLIVDKLTDEVKEEFKI